MFTLLFLAASAVVIKVQQVFQEKEEWAAYTEKQFQAARLERVEETKEKRTVEVQKKGKELLVAVKLQRLLDANPASLPEYLLGRVPPATEAVIQRFINTENRLPEVGDLPWKENKTTLYWAEALRQALSPSGGDKKKSNTNNNQYAAAVQQGPLV